MLVPTGQNDGVGAGVAAALTAEDVEDSLAAGAGFAESGDVSGGAMRMRTVGSVIDASTMPFPEDAARASVAGSRSKRGSPGFVCCAFAGFVSLASAGAAG